jgi:phosphoribosylformylglycinamidine synthase II
VKRFQVEVRALAEKYDVQAQRLAREILQMPPDRRWAGRWQASPLPSAQQSETAPEMPGRWQASPLPSGDACHRPGISGAVSGCSLPSPLSISTSQLYLITGNLTLAQIDQLKSNLLIDPVISTATFTGNTPGEHVVDVFFHPGVTDTLAESVIVGANLLGITGIERVETGRRYRLDARLSEAEVRTIAESLLYNPVIQQYTLHMAESRSDSSRVGARLIAPHVGTSQDAPVNEDTLATAHTEGTLALPPNPVGRDQSGPYAGGYPNYIPISDMSDEQLLETSKQGLLALNLDEMRAIQQHYREQGHEPTDVELETLAQTWSEHCSHKTFKATIVYREKDADGKVIAEETIHNLLKHYLMRATEAVEPSWLVSAFSDNAGIVRFTEQYDIAFKVETHNHPSAIEPFGGANTGVGGVIRDVLGVSAQPIACTDILCFGPPDTPVETLPSGILSPRRIASGVVNGVRDYGNKMGIPTVNGAVLYNEGYLYNPLVFCGCLGLLPHNSHPRNVRPGDLIVVLGGRTGRDGIHGATFSSGEMSSESNAQAGSAVQIGAPVTEKKVTDVIIQARDRQLYSAITDCGAGGFSSAIGEMGAETGVSVELEKAPLKYQGLAPWEIWLSEAQERMVLAVPPEHLTELLEICAIEEVEASILGTFTATNRLQVTYYGATIADIDMAFLHDGRPDRTLEAVWTHKAGGWDGIPRSHTMTYMHDERGPSYYGSVLLALLRHPTIASKEAIVRRYDHEVQGATVVKPLVGKMGNGPGDAAVLQPILDEPSLAGIVLSNGANPLYSKIDPYHMAMNAVDEALRNLTAVGGDIERAAILDNFCWGNPTDPEQLGMLVRAVKGCHDAAIGFGTPFISGKDSLNNEYRARGERLPVIPTLVISAVGVIDDAAHTVDMALKAPGNLLYLVGTTREEMGGSHYAEVVGREAFEKLFPFAAVPKVDVTHAFDSMKALGSAIRAGLVQSCHDLSEGGLAVALAEMALASSLGARINLGRPVLQDVEHPVGNIVRLFSESASRFIVEVSPDDWEAFERHMRSRGVHDIKYIGNVTDKGYLDIYDQDELIYLPVAELQRAWKGEQA